VGRVPHRPHADVRLDGERGTRGLDARDAEGITIQQKLGTQSPLDLPWRGEAGRDVTLRHYFTDRPVILNLAYFWCAMLCPQIGQGLAPAITLEHKLY
jgi:cytochrome oxidase Cu insertion factor (SCO1/SenC/PrrC family)